jgi:hypothetical protein
VFFWSLPVAVTDRGEYENNPYFITIPGKDITAWLYSWIKFT